MFNLFNQIQNYLLVMELIIGYEYLNSEFE